MTPCDHHLCRPSSEKEGHRECCICGALIKVPIVVEVNRCKGCGYPIDPSEDFCGECLCEDDGALY